MEKTDKPFQKDMSLADFGRMQKEILNKNDIYLFFSYWPNPTRPDPTRFSLARVCVLNIGPAQLG